MFDRRLLLNFDWVILLLVLMLGSIGIISLYSTSGGNAAVYTRQLYWLLVGFIFMIPMFVFSYQYLERFAYPIYVISLILLLLVLIFGRTSFGARRWLDVGMFSAQPSEFAKLAVILILSRYFSQRRIPDIGMSFKDFIGAFFLVVPPFLLIVKEPDLGTASTILLIAFSMILFAKVRLRIIIVSLLTLLVSIPFLWHFLKDYQKQRILSFLNPNLDPLGSGYHLIQSKIAIGSGGFLGRGFMQGTQSKLKFLPTQNTDFIFSVIAEEWGFIGSVFILGLFLFLILWILRVSGRSKDRFGAFLSFGIGSMIFWHVFINIGMVVGIFPVVGVPLPFLSYGGSFFLTLMIATGLIININMRRFMF
ncbi:MAG: rod shape-determining protein RodA [Thermodesulfobacteriota bacterium]